MPYHSYSLSRTHNCRGSNDFLRIKVIKNIIYTLNTITNRILIYKINIIYLQNKSELYFKI